MNNIMEFYKGKRVLVTGHTGFKGSWMCRCLVLAGASVCGYSIEPNTTPSLYELAKIDDMVTSVIADIRDGESLSKTFDDFKPEIVFHLAAQPIVRESYKNPVYTYETNVLGTVNVCECVRNSDSVRSFLNVTTDKVYDNKERENTGYKEDEPLDGYDPYSNSKSCSELVTHSYAKSFLLQKNIAVSTARAGNVIGGGDFAADRIIPDCVRSVLEGNEIIVRNPYSVRPYQHVLEPVFAYLLIGMEQYLNIEKAGWYNVGPDDVDCVTTGELVDTFCNAWEGATWRHVGDDGPHEAGFLKLDCTKLKKTFGWKPRWSIKEAIEKTIEFSKLLEISDLTEKNKLLLECMDRQIREYVNV